MSDKVLSPRWVLYSTYLDRWMPESAAPSRRECWLNGIAHDWPQGEVQDWIDARDLLRSKFYECRPYAEYKRGNTQGESNAS